MNLMINNYCNLKCSYCFAQETMHSEKAINVTMEDFCKYLDWLKEHDQPEVRLIGGEPTLSPDLPKLIDKVIEYNCFRNILLFSNMTFDKDVTKMIIEKSAKIKIIFLPNINELDLILPNLREKIIYNLDMLSMIGDSVKNFSLNIYSPDMDLSKWEDIICKYNIESIRFSIVVPNKPIDESFDYYEYFHSFQNVLLKLAEFAQKYKVFISNDCNSLPVCCFDDWAVIKLTKICPEVFYTTQYCYHPAIDLLPDLTVKSCFAAPTTGTKKLTDFKTIEELDQYIYQLRADKMDYIVRDECRSCDRFAKNGASCSCIYYRKIKK